MTLLNELKSKNISHQFLATTLNVNINTVKRWFDNNKIPSYYKIEIMKILGQTIDYSKFTSSEKDQFFTQDEMVTYCYNKFVEQMKRYNIDTSEFVFIEPSAGDGAFLKLLPNVIALDIEPRHKNISRQDYLTYKPPDGKYIVFGNPPFGLRGHLALKFINHSQFADFVCFILPPLFNSDGKGVPRKRVKNFNLIYSEKLSSSLFRQPDGKDVKINAIFQIWSKNIQNEEYILGDNNNDNIKIYSLSNGGTPSSTRNKKMLNSCDRYLPSTCFGKENMKGYLSFENLPNRRGYGLVFLKNKEKYIKKFDTTEWENISFLSTNSSYNLRTSKILNIFE